jgi:3D (Asp-Asp-Asp) domain-containing protein
MVPQDASLPLAETEVSKVAVEKTQEEMEYTVKLTAYNAVPEQTDQNPHTTASGAYSNPEVVVARSHDLASELPFGTIIAIERPEYQNPTSCGFDSVAHLLGYRVIADTTHKRKVNQIDVLLNQLDTVPVKHKEVNPSVALGICDDVVIRVVGNVAIADIPETQEELRYLVEGTTQLVLAK